MLVLYKDNPWHRVSGRGFRLLGFWVLGLALSHQRFKPEPRLRAGCFLNLSFGLRGCHTVQLASAMMAPTVPLRLYVSLPLSLSMSLSLQSSPISISISLLCAYRIYIYIHIYLYIYICAYGYICRKIHTCNICTSTSICRCVYKHTYNYLYIYMCMYICTLTYKHIRPHMFHMCVLIHMKAHNMDSLFPPEPVNQSQSGKEP